MEIQYECSPPIPTQGTEMEPNTNVRTQDEIITLLVQARTIAVVGVKDLPSEDAYRIPAYLKEKGYLVIPVNPKLSTVLASESFPSLSSIPETLWPIDIVNLFRAAEHMPQHVDEILSLPEKPRAVWTQLGIHHGPSAQRLRAAGIEVIQDRCIMVDHRNLIGVEV